MEHVPSMTGLRDLAQTAAFVRSPAQLSEGTRDPLRLPILVFVPLPIQQDRKNQSGILSHSRQFNLSLLVLFLAIYVPCLVMKHFEDLVGDSILRSL